MKGFLLGVDRLMAAWDTLYLRSRNLLHQCLQTVKRFCYRPAMADLRHPGYLPYRDRQVFQAIDQKIFATGRLPEGFGQSLDERIIEYPWFFSRLPAKPGRLLDAGSVLNFDSILRRSEFRDKRVFISTLAPETQSAWWRNISYTYEDLREASFRDEYFDWIVCLSTIEHVGMDSSVYTREKSTQAQRPEDAKVFLKELHRILKPGGTLFLSFPFGRTANLNELQIFDLAAVQAMVKQFQPRMESQNYFRHTGKGWKTCTPQQAADAGYFRKDTTPNPFGTVAAEAVACLELVK